MKTDKDTSLKPFNVMDYTVCTVLLKDYTVCT
jgi:hypothetical protein